MSIKIKSIGALFVALLIILAVNPKLISNIYSSILGRLFFICVVIFFAMNNTTLGLLVALVIITASNQFGSFVESMENQEPTTIGEDNVASTGPIKVLSKDAVKQKLSDLKAVADTENDANIGVDKIDIAKNMIPKNSNQIPIDKHANNSNSEVSASSSSMLKPSSATLEGFTMWGSVY